MKHSIIHPCRWVLAMFLLAWVVPTTLLGQESQEFKEVIIPQEFIATDSIPRDTIMEDLAEEMEELSLMEETYIFPTSLSDGWHLTTHAGIFQSWGSYTEETDFFNKTNPAFGLSIGKYLTPVNDIRLQFLWGRNTGVYGRNNVNEWGHHVPNWHFYSVSLAAQYLPNLTNLFYGYDENRRFTISALAGISLIRTFGYANHNSETKASLDSMSVWAESPRAGVPRSLVGLQFGALAEWRMTENTRLTLEVTDNFADDIFDGKLSGHIWDGHVNVLLGMTWHLYNNKASNARLRNRFNAAKYDDLNEVIYRNREKTKELESNPNIEIEEKDVRKKVTYTLVAMKKGEISVPRLQQANVYTTATLWNTYTARKQKAMVFVTNNSKVDDQTFHNRAWSICELLSRRWRVSANDIRVVADESQIKEMNLMGYDHYIIVVINETPFED